MAIRKKDNNCIMRGYRFCGIPQGEDENLEIRTFGCCRYLYNRMLSDHTVLYEEIGSVPNNTPADYKDLDECLFLNDVDSLALANVQIHLQNAFASFFKGNGFYPKFKSKRKCRDSYTTNALYSKKKDGSEACNIRFHEKSRELILPKHKNPVRLILHRKIKPGGKLKSVTVRREPDGKFYYTLLFEYPKVPADRVIDESTAVGLDMSLPELYIDSDGNKPVFPNPYRKMEKRLDREQRKLSGKKKNSANYKKQCRKVARIHAKIKHQREDFLHKASRNLVNRHDIIVIEDLDMNAMKRALRFGKSVSDNGWGKFVTFLQYKCEEEGKLLIKTDRWFPSSKTCGCCGYIHRELKLSDRIYFCPECGNVADRDVNAAKNIKAEGLHIYHEEYAA